MSVKIGHASIAENGTVYGSPGDQTGREVCTRDWYNGGWSFMAVHPDAAVREKHAKAVEQACLNDKIGYSWEGRNSLYQQAKAVGFDLSKITVDCNCDCSSLQNCCAVASGAPGVSYGSNGWVTTNMEPALRKAGYAILTDKALLQSADYAVRGAIYVSSGHTVCALGNGGKAAQTLEKAGAAGTAGTPTPTTGGNSAPQVVAVPSQSATSADSSPGGGAKARRRNCTVALPTLKQGDGGEDVRALQMLLIGRGFSCGSYGADGDFGHGTYGAVTRFQKARNLTVDGIVGAKTWEALLCG